MATAAAKAGNREVLWRRHINPPRRFCIEVGEWPCRIMKQADRTAPLTANLQPVQCKFNLFMLENHVSRIAESVEARIRCTVDRFACTDRAGLSDLGEDLRIVDDCSSAGGSSTLCAKVLECAIDCRISLSSLRFTFHLFDHHPHHHLIQTRSCVHRHCCFLCRLLDYPFLIHY